MGRERERERSESSEGQQQRQAFAQRAERRCTGTGASQSRSQLPVYLLVELWVTAARNRGSLALLQYGQAAHSRCFCLSATLILSISPIDVPAHLYSDAPLLAVVASRREKRRDGTSPAWQQDGARRLPSSLRSSRAYCTSFLREMLRIHPRGRADVFAQRLRRISRRECLAILRAAVDRSSLSRRMTRRIAMLPAENSSAR